MRSYFENENIRGYWARALCNNDFICIETYSGYVMVTIDPKGVQHLLLPDAGDVKIGEAALDAMAHSRFVAAVKSDGREYPAELTFDLELFAYESHAQWYKNWVKDLMERYGYKTKRKLFTGMKHCDIVNKNGVITISPYHHVKLEAWDAGDLTKEDNVVIPDTSSAAEIGAALRLAFSRCTGR